MCIRVVSLFCLLLFAPHSYAQERTTYLLIDASGSMAEKDAEGEIKKLLSPITAQNPKALVSRTYFRAAEAKMCWMPVGIEQPVPADESLSESIDFHNDFTPLGEALKAAILHALKGGGQADIFLISDEEQT